MHLPSSGIAGLLDDFSFSDWLKADPVATQKQTDIEKNLALQSGIFPAAYGGQPSKQIAGSKMQNTSDLTYDLSPANLSKAASAALTKVGFVDTTSPVLPDFLRNATTINNTVQAPSAGAWALALKNSTPWYKDRTKLMVAGGIAIVLAGLFIFTGNSGSARSARKRTR